MSPSVFIRRRSAKTGVRWHVRYRPGGREAREVHDSVWPTKALAERRRAAILQAWTEGRQPPPVPRDTTDQPAGPTVAGVLDDYTASRRDVGAGRHKTYRQVRLLLGPLDAKDPAAVTVHDVRAWIGTLDGGGKSRETIRNYLGVLRQVLDHADLPANPARHPSIRLPHQQRGDMVRVPVQAEWAAIQQAITPRHLLTVRALEATGLRIGELVALTWGDVDLRGLRLRVRGTKTAAGMRWVPLPEWFAMEVTERTPLEDRHADLPVLAANEQTVRGAMRRACRDAGVAHYSPHDLRHRYISLLIAAGTPVPIVKLVVGHVKGSTTLDTYAHVLVDEDPRRLARLREDAVRVVAATSPDGGRSDGTAPVWPSEGRSVGLDNETPGNLGVPAGVEDTGLEYRGPE